MNTEDSKRYEWLKRAQKALDEHEDAKRQLKLSLIITVVSGIGLSVGAPLIAFLLGSQYSFETMKTAVVAGLVLSFIMLTEIFLNKTHCRRALANIDKVILEAPPSSSPETDGTNLMKNRRLIAHGNKPYFPDNTGVDGAKTLRKS